MTTEEIIADAMALPLTERVLLAQALWESIDAGLPDVDESAAVKEAIQRDEDLSSGRVAGSTHEEVMKAALTEVHKVAE
jgi:putative addiction module component (TIGR02574 family)